MYVLTIQSLKMSTSNFTRKKLIVKHWLTNFFTVLFNNLLYKKKPQKIDDNFKHQILGN